MCVWQCLYGDCVCLRGHACLLVCVLVWWLCFVFGCVSGHVTMGIVCVCIGVCIFADVCMFAFVCASGHVCMVILRICVGVCTFVVVNACMVIVLCLYVSLAMFVL